jgi:hypothetical protein
MRAENGDPGFPHGSGVRGDFGLRNSDCGITFGMDELVRHFLADREIPPGATY